MNRQHIRAWIVGIIAIAVSIVVFIVPFVFVLFTGVEDSDRGVDPHVLTADPVAFSRRTSAPCCRPTTTSFSGPSSTARS